jgi:hypothetical protein
MNNTIEQKTIKVKALAKWGLIKEGDVFEARLLPSLQKNAKRLEFLNMPIWTMHPFLLLSDEKLLATGHYKKFEIVRD